MNITRLRTRERNYTKVPEFLLSDKSQDRGKRNFLERLYKDSLITKELENDLEGLFNFIPDGMKTDLISESFSVLDKENANKIFGSKLNIFKEENMNKVFDILNEIKDDEFLIIFKNKDFIKDMLEEKDQLVYEKELKDNVRNLKEKMKTIDEENFRKEIEGDHIRYTKKDDIIILETVKKIEEYQTTYVKNKFILDNEDNFKYKYDIIHIEGNRKMMDSEVNLSGDPIEYYYYHTAIEESIDILEKTIENDFEL